jgi:predicted dehydrogenase
MSATPSPHAAGELRRPARLGIIGGGDIAHRAYVPLLKRVSDANVDSLSERWTAVKAVSSIDELRAETDVDAVYNLTPAVVHDEVTKLALHAGLHVFSEKPLAPSVERASELIELAEKDRRLLLCAPGNAASPRFKWVSDLIRSGEIKEPHLVTAQIANMGPATWAVYKSDPRTFYDVGPLVDMGIYALHWMTGLLGPATQVQAVASTALPDRVARTLASDGVPFSIAKPDQMLIHLTFANALGQLFASFAAAGTRAPSLEIHGADTSFSLQDLESSWGGALICSPSSDGASPPDWREIEPPASEQSTPTKTVIQDGAEHFVACVNGRARPLLTAEHARHAAEIIAAVDESAATGASVPLTTTFQPPRPTR